MLPQYIGSQSEYFLLVRLISIQHIKVFFTTGDNDANGRLGSSNPFTIYCSAYAGKTPADWTNYDES